MVVIQASAAISHQHRIEREELNKKDEEFVVRSLAVPGGGCSRELSFPSWLQSCVSRKVLYNMKP